MNSGLILEPKEFPNKNQNRNSNLDRFKGSEFKSISNFSNPKNNTLTKNREIEMNNHEDSFEFHDEMKRKSGIREQGQIKPIKFKKLSENNNSLFASFRKELLCSQDQIKKTISDSRKTGQKLHEIRKNYGVENKIKVTEDDEGDIKKLSSTVKKSISKPSDKKNNDYNLTLNGKKTNSNKKLSIMMTEINGSNSKLPSLNKFRNKIFSVNLVDNWYEKNGYPQSKLSNEVINNIDFQSNVISDELKILLDNIQYFKMNFLNGQEIYTIFKSLSFQYQIKYNKVLEESVGLMIEISNSILLDFYHYLEKFVSIQPPSPEKLLEKPSKNEFSSFVENIQLLYESSAFCKGCFEVYQILVRQVEDMIIPLPILVRVLQFLARARNNISHLIFLTKNNRKNYFHDLQLINKYKRTKTQEKELFDDKKGVSVIKQYINHKNKDKYFQKNIQEPKKEILYNINEELERKKRINNVLSTNNQADEDNSFEEKKKKAGQKFRNNDGINSQVVTKLLKYCNKDIRNKIVAQRIIERYQDQNSEDFDDD